MATAATQTGQQNQPTQVGTNPEGQPNQPSRAEATRGSQRSGLARRGGYAPLGFPLTPLDLFFNPFSLMRRMTEELDRSFGQSERAQASTGAVWAPAIEVSERDGKCVVRVELAGLKPEDVKLEITDDALVLQGERKVEREEDRGGIHRTEIRYGQFYRVVPLPEGAEADQVEAKFNHGVLEVTIPVSEPQSQRREIPIQTGSTSPEGGSQKPSSPKQS
jgi:HSP20 family protein